MDQFSESKTVHAGRPLGSVDRFWRRGEPFDDGACCGEAAVHDGRDLDRFAVPRDARDIV